MATFMERLAFLQKVPTLMKATADDENPCPGYLFQEIGSILWQPRLCFSQQLQPLKGASDILRLLRYGNILNHHHTVEISHESSGCGQCLLEYLLERLQVESCHVKLKVLKIFVHLCGHGSNQFLTELRRNSTFIQQASVYSGPPDPIHGTALYQKVRNTAQEVARLLFTDTISTKTVISPLNVAPPTMGMGSGTSHRSGMQGFGYSPGKQGTAGSDSLLDKIQKAAEVVASAVLPPTEHQGIRLHDNHYRAVVAPSAPIEVAVPACAYNVPARRPKALTQRCPGQAGGGWEETDSGNSSSHNSSQDIAANSRASVGSKSAGTGSQSGASRESSGDLSDRVEALHLGDCGQEMALISRLTEGSRVFLSREESQHFIKECSILNCEVVVELLTSKLQDPSNIVRMRSLCAISCLMTSDLLSLEQMFGATQRKLHQLSEGAPGPVANKATKILRQFEALMGGSLHAPRQDTASSSHQAATTNQLPTSTYSGPLLPTHSTGNTNLNHYQPDTSLTGVAQPPNHPSSPSSLALAQRDSSGEVSNDGVEEKLSPIQQQLEVQPVRTAEVKLVAEESELNRGSSHPAEPHSEQPCLSRLSLFSGMELVTKGRPLCEGETSQTGNSLRENLAVHNISISDGAPPICSLVVADSSQPVSAFSFLNF
ncbi:AP-4 complex accessory subunit tepsin isoform X2 [Micropterus dolomieu]|uniref:AP-4 complex accessory subunit tepsin isoform X2 n=1 Tax=Micropterus dolomieu TaxID=147949 RepID=UPI001E8E42CF|nr:AP-4 complex accessory subunit tepsin isoform X2 [Micropterus dolomieu]